MDNNTLIPVEPGNQGSRSYPYGYPAAIDAEVLSPSSPSISLSFVTAAIRRWWKICLPVGLILGAGVALATWFLMEPEYESAAWLLIHSSKPFLVEPGAGGMGEGARFRGTQAQLIQNPVVLNPVLNLLTPQELSVMPQARDQQLQWMKERIVVASPQESELFMISFRANDPKMAKNVVTLIVGEYLRYRREVDRVEKETEIIRGLDEEETKHKNAVKLIQGEIQNLYAEVFPGQEAQVFDERGSGFVQSNPLALLESKKLDAMMEKAIMQRELRELQSGMEDAPTEPPAELVDAALTADDRIAAKQAEVDEAKRLYDDAFNKAPEMPMVGRLKTSWDKAEDELAALREELRPEITTAMMKAAAAETKSRKIQREAELKGGMRNFEEYENVLSQQIGKKTEELKTLSASKLRLEDAQRRLNLENDLLSQLNVRRTLLQTERAAPEQVTLASQPELPTRPSNTAWPYVVLAGVGCLFFPFGLAMGWEFLARRVATSKDLTLNPTINVIGEITQFPSRRMRVDAELEGTPVYEESVDQVCASLMYSPNTEEMKVFAVCSAVSGEGKTSVAAQLAMSFARATADRVLLIDGDLRDPDLAQLFNVEEAPGLAEVLASRCSPREAIITDWSPKLHLLPAGYLNQRPQSLFGQGRFKEALKELAAGYDYVIVDTPPVLCASEALAIAKAADGVLFCSMRDKSRSAQVNAAITRIREAGGNTIGCILSGIPKREYLSHYGNYAKAYAVDATEYEGADDAWEAPQEGPAAEPE